MLAVVESKYEEMEQIITSNMNKKNKIITSSTQ